MELTQRLSTLKSQVLQRIEDALRREDVSPLKGLAELAAAVDADLRAARELEARLAAYGRQLAGDAPADRAIEVEEPDPRTPFLSAAAKAGHPLQPMSRTLYLTAAGKSVAVPFANESRPGRWLLSMEDMRYDLIALLCQPAEGALRIFVVPRRVLDPVWKGFSRSGRHVKLGVAGSPEGFRLQVPGGEPVPLDDFAGAYALLGQS